MCVPLLGVTLTTMYSPGVALDSPSPSKDRGSER